jgi:folylpolyglutamate synthase/dihydropteroate synthase
MKMSDYAANVQKFSASPNQAAIDAIVKYCGIALRNADSSLVSCTDPAELERVRDGFAAKKLGLDAAAAEAAMSKVCQQMKTEHNKSRVTFYYLLAETTGNLSKLA